MKTFSKKLVSAILALSLVLGGCTAVFAGNEESPQETFRYVNIGDSVHQGYGLPDYFAKTLKNGTVAPVDFASFNHVVKGSVPYLLNNYFKDRYKDKDVETTQMGFPSMRVYDAQVLLDDSLKPDFYFNYVMASMYMKPAAEYYGYLRAEDNYSQEEMLKVFRQMYREKIAAADVITLDLGVNDVPTCMASMPSLGMDADLDSLLKNIGFTGSVEDIKERFKALLPKSLPADTKEQLMLYVDGAVFAYVDATFNMDKLLEKIYKLNPDVTIIMSALSGAEDVKIDLDGKVFPVGKIFTLVYELISEYRMVQSPYAKKYLYADKRAADVELYQALIEQPYSQWTEETKSVAQVMISGFGLSSDVAAKSEVLKRFADLIQDNYAINSEFVFFTDREEEAVREQQRNDLVCRYLQYGKKASGENYSAEELAYIKDWVNFSNLRGAYSITTHPDLAGHQTLAAKNIEALEYGKPARVYHAEKVTGIYKFRNELLGNFKQMAEIAEMIRNKSWTATDNPYDYTIQLNKVADKLIQGVERFSPRIAAKLKDLRNLRSAVVIFGSYLYENAGYMLYTPTASSSMLAIMGEGGNREAMELLAGKLYGGTEKLQVCSTSDDYLSAAKKADLIVIDINRGLVNMADVSSYVKQLTEIVDAIEKACPNAVIAVTGIRGAGSEEAQLYADMANMSVLANALIGNSIYVDMTDIDSTYVCNQLYKHLRTAPKYRDYSDMLASFKKLKNQ